MRTDTEATVELWQEQAMHNLQAAEDFKLELADARRDICDIEQQLTSERALADRLAEAMQGVMLEERDLPVASCRGFIDFDQAILALAAWKEARSEI